MTREELDFIGSMNMCDEISNEAYKKIVCHCEEQEPCDDAISRQAALNCFTATKLKKFDFILYAREEIKKLPPVNPQMTDQWNELKETIIEMRDNNGTGTQQEVCRFLANLMDVLEKQMQEPKTGHWIDTNSKRFEFHGVYKCSECGNTEIEYPEGIRRHFRYCPNCGVEQEPCEDAVSRQAVIDGINEYFHDEYYQRTSIQDCRDCLIEDVIRSLPPVNPQPKTGHWIWNIDKTYCKCSKCGIGMGHTEYDYCPNCGAKMLESEGKE